MRKKLEVIGFFGIFLLGFIFINGLSTKIYSQTKTNQSNNQKSTADKWIGKYELFTSALIPKSKDAGMVPEAEYTLTVSKSDESDGLSCNFLAVGVQLHDEFVCSVKADGNKLQVYFVKDLTGREPEFIFYKKGQLLFTLQSSTRTPAKYFFKPSAYKIIIPGRKMKALYFDKNQ